MLGRETGLTGPKGVVKGIAVGLAVIVPGMSAGTAALMLGIYRPLIFALRSLALLRLIPLGLGTAVGVLGGARTIGWLLEVAPERLGAFLAGLVLAATWPVLLECLGGDDGHPRRGELRSLAVPLGLLVIGFSGVWVMGPEPLRGEGAGGLLWLLTAGLLSASAMLLPGVSGGTVLVILGEYGRLVHALNTFDWLLLGVFAAGVLAGLLGFVRVVAALLERQPAGTMALLAGMMLGSVRHLLPVTVGVGELVWLLVGFGVVVPFWRGGGSGELQIGPEGGDRSG